MVESLPDEPTAVIPFPPVPGPPGEFGPPPVLGPPGVLAPPGVPRRRWPIVVAAAAVLAVALLAGTGWAILHTATTGAPAAGPTPTGSIGSVRSSLHRVRGTILTEDGTTWTVRAANGRTVTVLLTAGTAFGTAKRPATAADFPVGTAVAVTGTVNHETVTATRIAAAARSVPTPSTSG